MQKQPSQRQLRVGEQIKHIVAETMTRGGFQNPVLMDSMAVTVTEVRASPDLKNATAYVVPLMGNADLTDVLKALNDEAHVFQREIGRQSALKFTPRLHFKSDGAFDEGQKIEDLLRSITYAEDNE